MKIIFFFALSILLNSQESFGRNVKYLMIRPLKGQEILGQTLSSSLNRTMLKHIASQPGFEIILNTLSLPEQTTETIYAIEGTISKKLNFFDFTLNLLDLKNQIVIKSVSQTNIREEDLIRIIRGGLEALFLPLENEKKKIKSTKDTAIKNGALIVTSNNNEKVIDFKQRIKGLQNAADAAVSNKTNANGESTDSNNKNSTLNSPNNQMAVRSQIQVDAKDSSILDKLKKNFRDHRLGLIYEMRSIQTESYIITQSDMTLMQLRIDGQLWQNLSKIWGLNYELSLTKPLSSVIEAPDLKSYSISNSLNGSGYSFHLGLSREDFLFFNITQPGAGLESGTIQGNFLKAALHLKPRLLDRQWLLAASYATTIIADTDWSSLKNAKNLAGNYFSLELIPPFIVYGCNFRIMIRSNTITAQGDTPFKLNDTRLLAGASYTF